MAHCRGHVEAGFQEVWHEEQGMEGKKIAVIVVLLAVVIGAVVFTVKRTTSGPQAPSWVLDQVVQKIDIKTLELVKAPTRDWMGKYAPDASGYYKNPKTGEYTVAETMQCISCGQLIPVMQLPAELRGKPVARTPMPGASADRQPPGKGGVDPEAIMKLQREYKCPRCGKNAYPVF